MKSFILLAGLLVSGCAVVPIPAYNYGGVQADIYPDVYVAPQIYVPNPNPVIISNNYIAPRRQYNRYYNNYRHHIRPPIYPPHYRPHIYRPIPRTGPARINQGFRQY